MIQYKSIHGIPICHYRMEFALWVRKAILTNEFDTLAVELPSSVRQGYLTAIDRLPYLSVLIYKDQKGENIYLPVEPCDPMTEAVRSAREKDMRIEFIDLDIDDYPTQREWLPDSYSLCHLSLDEYYNAWLQEVGKKQIATHFDDRRERYMAYKLQQLQLISRKTLFVCGMSHLHRVMEHLKTEQVLPLGFYRRQNARVFNVSEESSRSCLGEFGLVSAAYELWRSAKEIQADEKDSSDSAPFQSREGSLSLLQGRKQSANRPSESQKILDILRRNISKWQSQNTYSWIDRRLILQLLFEMASTRYEDKLNLKIKLWQERAIGEFLKKRCMLENQLVPHFFQLVNAGKGVVDDDFAYELWEIGTTYPFQEEKPSLVTVDLSPDEVWMGSEKIKFRKRIPSQKSRALGIPQRLRPRENKPGDWKKEFQQDGLCSYPVEDLAIESFSQSLKKKGASVLALQNCRTEPFSASLLDGIDYRETIRNLGDKRLYVKEMSRFDDQMGSIVFIFEEDLNNEKFNYRLTWLGEHEQESDLAFYATNFEDQLVGPGIGRAYYGGLMMSFPPRRLHDIWSDPDYLFIPKKHEVLLAAAIEYSIEKNVVYVGPSAPRTIFKNLAERMGKRVIYIPLGSFSRSSLDRIRRFHVLAGHEKRQIIKDYL